MNVVAKKTSSKQKVFLFVNTHSLMGAEWLEQFKEKLAERGVKLTAAEGFSKADALFERLKKQAQGESLVIVGGGDGTLSGAADILAHSACILGILHLGTGNAFARDLGIPTDLDKAIEVLVAGKPCEIDLGVCDGRRFVNVITIGLTSTVARTLTVPMKRRFGRFVYAIAIARARPDVYNRIAALNAANTARPVAAAIPRFCSL